MKIINPLYDKAFKYLRQLEGEDELDEIFDMQEAKYLKQIEEAKQQIEEAKHQIEEAKHQEEAQKQRNIEIIKNLYKSGMEIEKIAGITGKTASEIKDILR